ncbi:starch synthase (maltosyl-transferring) [Actinopolymorpha cephalotaxi]|uniref:Alpha-1,4-glucan:maltose-1-phosphate maltosyltransferase n=1 Tax=Actinopolymorpha cephalotaxi TaxID=504797 RepID=A0A1I2ZH46_9ACTN|nr:alpha-1,4-glucan--maltose-1-phosphate maltosyltransferase [Actinopolymorpha cephalotaxi]NYH81994.1 starch synthase (maltosyl-transferring) [Actinopolymorpha cephalotaxi]SFH37167.1 starch synthase (maltosyl-transferring) [Actinopolymorpha cephalotaxi]
MPAKNEQPRTTTGTAPTASPVTAATDGGASGTPNSPSPSPASPAATAATSTVFDTVVGRIPIINVTPDVRAGGRLPAKAVAGESLTVEATVFREGHDALGANVVTRGPGGRTLGWTPMRCDEPGTDRWSAQIRPDAEGDWTYSVEAWSHPVATWRHAAEVKIAAGVDVELMLAEGAIVLERAGANLPGEEAHGRDLLQAAVRALRDDSRPAQARLYAATAPDVEEILAAHPLRDMVTTSEEFPLRVDRERALYGSWYEFFPRSEGAYYDEHQGRWVSGTFKAAADRLPAIADLGFDVVYLPPIHPIGRVNRKGPNNTLDPAPGDPGSPWGIGSDEGGHDAVHPDLGTLEDFDAFVARANELGLEIALDLALQAAPDHPWVKEHPEWFTTLADGTIAYAENPPKKYQDIYPINFDNDPAGIYAEVLRVVRHWMSHGVRIFRVDNPHTKPVRFWEWLLAEVRRTDPDVLFLSEAFTRPPMLQTLAKVGFHQSYTYFTWRNTKEELESYFTELSHESSDFVRPNFFTNTQDILTSFLQTGGLPAFRIRAALAATGSPTWGVYSGFELGEHVALRPGSEEYLHSEKYQYRPRDWAAYEPGAERAGESIAPYLRQLNEIRRRHPALQRLRNLALHQVPDPNLLVFSKRDVLPDGRDDTVIVVINIDPYGPHDSVITLDMPALGLDWHDSFVVQDEFTGDSWRWGQHNYVRLDPAYHPAHILTLQRGSA